MRPAHARSPFLALLCALLFSLPGCGDSSQNPKEEGCVVTGCPSSQRCNPDSGRCELLSTCERADQCAPGEECLGQVCSSCMSNIQCTVALSKCDPLKLECVGCQSDAECGGATPHCEQGAACLECTQDAHCPGGRCFRGWCGECRDSEDCPSGEVCQGGQCRSRCYAPSECGGSTPYCHDNLCVACRHDEDCATGQACYEGFCRAPYPGDTCRSAVPLQLGGGSVVVEGDVPYGYQGSTGYNSSEQFQDVLYSVDITQEGYLNAQLTPRGLAPDVSVAILTGACNDMRVMASASRLLEEVFVTPGRYLVRVADHGFGFLDGFRLKVWLTPGTRATGNHCLKPTPLGIGQPGGSETGFTANFQDMLPTSPDLCDDGRAEPQPDLIYSLTLAERSRVEVAATPLNVDDRIEIFLKESCWDGDGVCSYQSTPGEKKLTRGPLEPGTYALVVRSRVGGGPVAVQVKVTPWATNSTCDTALPIQFDASGVAVLSGDTTTADGGVGGCDGGLSSGVLHYQLSTVGLGAHSLTAEIQAANGGGSIGVDSTCRVEQNDQAQFCPGTGLAKVTDLPEGVYDLTVKQAGAFTLTLRLGEAFPKPANDSCTNAQTLPLGMDQRFSVTADTRGARPDISDRCGTNDFGTSSRDVAFAVPLSERGRLYATVHPLTEGYNPALMLASICASGVDACFDNGGTSADESGSFRWWGGASSANAFIWVGARDGSEGAFELSGRFEPVPAHDACTGAEPLTATASGFTANGDIGFGFPDNDDPCVLSSSRASLYYQFTAASRTSYRIRLVPSGFDATLSAFTSACGSTSSTCTLPSVNAAGVDGAEELTIPSSNSSATFRIGVHGATVEAEGTFTLTVEPL